jgi:hypothetical protein
MDGVGLAELEGRLSAAAGIKVAALFSVWVGKSADEDDCFEARRAEYHRHP